MTDLRYSRTRFSQLRARLLLPKIRRASRRVALPVTLIFVRIVKYFARIVRKKNFLSKLHQRRRNYKIFKNSCFRFLTKLKLFKDDRYSKTILFENHFQPKRNIKSLSSLFSPRRSSWIFFKRQREERKKNQEKEFRKRKRCSRSRYIVEGEKEGERDSLKRRRFRGDAGV